MVSLVLDDPEPVLWGGELVYRDGVSAGHTTSGAYGYTLGASVALAWLDVSDGPLTRAAVEAATYEVDISGERAPASAALSSPFDPERSRVLC
jgi:4-methylaminobutanoate oxidase (formaldehyde-forming)